MPLGKNLRFPRAADLLPLFLFRTMNCWLASLRNKDNL